MFPFLFPFLFFHIFWLAVSYGFVRLACHFGLSAAIYKFVIFILVFSLPLLPVFWHQHLQSRVCSQYAGWQVLDRVSNVAGMEVQGMAVRALLAYEYIEFDNTYVNGRLKYPGLMQGLYKLTLGDKADSGCNVFQEFVADAGTLLKIDVKTVRKYFPGQCISLFEIESMESRFVVSSKLERGPLKTEFGLVFNITHEFFVVDKKTNKAIGHFISGWTKSSWYAMVFARGMPGYDQTDCQTYRIGKFSISQVLAYAHNKNEEIIQWLRI